MSHNDVINDSLSDISSKPQIMEKKGSDKSGKCRKEASSGRSETDDSSQMTHEQMTHDSSKL